MFELPKNSQKNKTVVSPAESDLSEKDLLQSALALVEGETNTVANLANLSSLIFYSFTNLNWVGFYLWSDVDKELVLGPFQGKPACLRIKPHRGVCGAAYTTQKVQRVKNVNEFSGHIACDGDTLSELVIPIIINGKCIGVLDLDSPTLDRFSENDEVIFTKFVEAIKIKVFNSLSLQSN